jgi:hypothetical protein
MVGFSILVTLFGIAFISMAVESALAQSITSQNTTSENTTSRNTTSPSNISLSGPFEGKSIKVIAFTSFFKTNEWELIDKYSSSGYEIKAVVQTPDKYFVVLQNKTS